MLSDNKKTHQTLALNYLGLGYLGLRYQIYQQQLKAMFTALAQMLYFFMMALYLALPAMFLSALISLSVIADINTDLLERVGYQWGYFLLIFLLIRVQKSAILASQYQYFNNTLIVANKWRITGSIGLTLLAGNAPLLAPSLLALWIPNVHILMNQFYFVLFAINVLLTAFFTLKNKSFLWLSLFIFPITALLLSKHATLITPLASTRNATLLNFLWLAMLLLETLFSSYLFQLYARLKSNFALNKTTFSLSGKHYWQFRLIDIKQQLAPNLTRLFSLLLIIMTVLIFQSRMHAIANIPIQLFISYLFSLLIGSYHYDNEAFYQQYRYYLSSILLTPKARYFYDNLSTAFLALIILMVSIGLLNFNLWILLILPITTAITVISIHYFPRNFFIAPSIFTLSLVCAYLYF